MCAGQTLDLAAEGRSPDRVGLERLQALKTGAMIGFACTAGAILGAAAPGELAALRDYAHDLGLAFQIADDLLDVEGDAAALGKAVRADAARGKATLVALEGAEAARRRAEGLARQAADRLAIFGRRADILQQAAAFAVSRRN
jgi:farnesyl diphosphate synthase